MVEVPVSFNDWERSFADLPQSVIKNRFFEKNPLEVKGAALVARPPTQVLTSSGSGIMRAFYSLPGLFGGALFYVCGNTLYRRDPDGTTYTITGYVYGSGKVSFTGVAGSGYERLFIADGSHLQFYSGGTQATAILTFTLAGHVAVGDTVEINGTYYEFVDTVTTGSGTAADPWKVRRGATTSLEDATALANAINFVGTPGTDWSSNLGGQNSDVTAAVTSDAYGNYVTITARLDNTVPNSYSTTDPTDAGSVMSWGGLTMSGGGVHGLSGVEVPDGLPPISVTTLKSYVLIAIGSSDKWFFIRPGTVIIDALDFYTAESQPDDVLFLTTVGDTAWFVGESSCEIWYATGSSTDPFSPVNGRVYDRGAIDGTVVNIKGTVYLVGPDFVVYAVSGGPQRVSNHGIEETIRKALGA